MPLTFIIVSSSALPSIYLFTNIYLLLNSYRVPCHPMREIRIVPIQSPSILFSPLRSALPILSSHPWIYPLALFMHWSFFGRKKAAPLCGDCNGQKSNIEGGYLGLYSYFTMRKTIVSSETFVLWEVGHSNGT